MLHDTFNLALANLVQYAQAITLHLRNECEYIPWNAVFDQLNYIHATLFNLPEFNNWKVCVLSFCYGFLFTKMLLYPNFNFLGIYDQHTVTPYILYNYIGFQELFSDSHFTILSRIDAFAHGSADCKFLIACKMKSQNATVLMQTPSSIKQ